MTGERDGYYQDFGEATHLAKAISRVFVYDGCYSRFHRRRHGTRVGKIDRTRFVVCVQNHDQVGNRARGDRLAAIVAPAADRLACGLLLLSPCVPLLFMGEEYGETRPFPYFCSFGDADLVEVVRRGRREEFAAMAFAWGAEIPDPQSPETFAAAKLAWAWPEGSPQAGNAPIGSGPAGSPPRLARAPRSTPHELPAVGRSRCDGSRRPAGTVGDSSRWRADF